VLADPSVVNHYVTDDIDFEDRLRGFGSDRYKELRPPQARALEGYVRTGASDLAIELPTGYGKTLVALLIADLALEQGKTVGYLTGTNQLADQVRAQAADLPGLTTVKFSSKNYPAADLAAYHDATAVGVMNYWTYFNTSPKMEPADVLIFDDAHLAEQALAGMFAIRVPRATQQPLYERLCDLVLAHTDLYPSIELMREGGAGPSIPPELLAFPHWAALAESAADVLTNDLPEETRYVWPIVRPRLRACGVLIGPSAIEIRPYHPPTQTLPGYRHSSERLYLSATLGTMDDLQRRLGVGPVVSVLDEPVTEDAVGQRTFILNPTPSGALSDPLMNFVVQQSDAAGRAAWLCSSHAEADEVEGLLRIRGLVPYRLRGGGDDGALERWALDDRGHLVTAGRFDGLDLAGDLCRLVILPSVPAASTEFERFVMAYLGDATFMRHRVGQRVTQALGRANRRDNDWAMYLGLAPGFGTLLAQSAVRQAIPIDVRPVIDDALARLESRWAGASSSASEFWQNRGVPVAPVNSPTAPARVRPGRSRAAATAGSAADEVAAVTRLWLGDPAGAADAAGSAAAILKAAGEVEHAAFWRYVQAQAHFDEGTGGSVGRAIDALRVAVEGGTVTAWFVRLGRVLSELRGQQASRVDDQPWTMWDEWVAEAGSTGVRRAVDRCRQYLLGTHDQQAEGIETLGRMVGVSSGRPTGQSVTDATWSWVAARKVERRLWEVKTGDPDELPREWVDQALGQVAAARPSPRLRVVGCLLTHLTTVADEAATAGRDALCFVHQDAALALADMIGDRLIDYAEQSGEGSAAERGSAREAVEPRMPTGQWLSELFGPSGGRVVRRDDVISHVPT
jgi:hypothetical protein